MARLLADEHFPVGIVNALRRLGHDVLTVRQVNVSKSGDATPDDLVLEWAAHQQRIVVTMNRKDYRRLHQENARHAGILCCNDPGAQPDKKVARKIDAFLKENDMNSRFERLSL
jgi:uncharacterized protein with PIN domain